MTPRRSPLRGSGLPPGLRLALPLVLVLLFAAGCGEEGSSSSASQGGGAGRITISAIPDQDPEKLQRLYGKLAAYLEKALEVPVVYRPVTDYTASVSLFRTGDLDMVWFGGLTGVQARLRVKGAQAILQRDIDESFHSVFVANTATGLRPVGDVSGLGQLRGRRFTFGSESSTSGRLMPQFFLDQAGVKVSDLAGPPGYSGSHDKTIELVRSGTYEAGALNEQVWASRLAAGQVDTSKVVALFRTPPYHDYHWVVRPEMASRHGPGFLDKVKQAFLRLDVGDDQHEQILELFGARRFIETSNANYAHIEDVARKTGLLR